MRDFLKTFPVMDSVAGVQQTARQKGDALRADLPHDLLRFVRVFQYLRCVSAWRVVPRSAMFEILDTVRTRVLNFALELEDQHPEAGEVVGAVTQERLSHVFKTTIYGNVTNFAAGNRDVVQTADTIAPGDYRSLQSYLNQIGVAQEDVGELKAAIEADKAAGDKGIGQRVSAWMASMIRKSASGGWDVGIGAAGNLLGEAIARSYGIFPP